MVFVLVEESGDLISAFMPRFKPYDYRQSLMVALTLEEQLAPGTLEHALHHLIEERISEEWFEELYANEETGRPAYSPKLLLKVILLGYARGIIGSRRLERACRENVVFMPTNYETNRSEHIGRRPDVCRPTEVGQASGVDLAPVAARAGSDPALRSLAAAVTGAAIGFLVWNWSPARVFLGDVGSVPLGYVLGFLLLGLTVRGDWRIALILPLYFLADATITLTRRLLRGERVWQAHREHFYQQAVRRGLGHAAVVERVIAADLMLIGCGWAAENGWSATALAASAATVAILLTALARGS